MSPHELATEIFKKTGTKILEDDPVFIIVELNRLVLENTTSEAAKQLSKVTKDFHNQALKNADDFVAIANETLSKFTKKTNEIQAALEEKSTSKECEQDLTWSRLKPCLVPVFSIGCFVGITLGILFSIAFIK